MNINIVVNVATIDDRIATEYGFDRDHEVSHTPGWFTGLGVFDKYEQRFG